MERRIGEKFNFKDITLEVMENNMCSECYFFKEGIRCSGFKNNILGCCYAITRKDGKYIIFKKVEE